MKGQIKLNENELRNFISYSVAKLLKESRPIYFDHNGVLDYDGEEDDGRGDRYGVIKLEAFNGDYDDIILPVAKQLFGDDIPFDSETMDDDDDWFDTFYRRILDVNGIDDISVEVSIDDDAYLKDYKIRDPKYDAADPKLKKFMDIITKEILDRIDDGETIFFKLNPNLYESTKKIHISKDEISEMIRKQVNMIKESIGLDVEHGAGLDVGDAGDDSQEQSSYPTEASCGFVEKYGTRNVKCRLHARIDDAEVEITLFQNDPNAPKGYKWEPQMSWWFSVEEYTNGEWLPYWETFAGDSSVKSFRRFWPRISKLLAKIGYLIDEDDEIPFA